MTQRATRSRGLRAAEALDLPVTFDVWPTLGEALQIGRTATYQLAREDALPIPCFRVGRQLRARRSDLLTFLGIHETKSNGAEAATSTPLAEQHASASTSK
ncbi:DNA-binding protein [Streptomyces sp. V4-01]|uniref:DNA-binding protein n=1 Tax=Actinacidiphila polyblastidii TaxID=3110430 RepID=A0ABU7PM39_9ACTN|nr:DNA-binding protein [Streptomyces sp. V4-01]